MSRRIVNIAVVLLLVVLSLAIVGGSMSKPVGRDEQMYCTAGVLMAQGKTIYRDFSYAAQLPYHPLLYAAVYRISGTSYYLLAGRLVSVVSDIAVMLCIVGIYRRIFGRFRLSGAFLAAAAVVLYVFNPLVDYANGYAWNHDVVILCVVLSFWLFISTDFKGQLRYGRIAAIGALLTFASCMRITTVLVELLFLAVLLSHPAGSIRKRFERALPFLSAAGIVLIWPAWVVAQAPRAFYLNLVKIPVLYGEWLKTIGVVFNKFELTTACLATPGYFVLIAMAVYLGLAVFFLRRRLEISNGRNLLLAALLPVMFFVVALIPPTMWRQYLAVPVPFLVIAPAYPLLYVRKLGGKTGVEGHFKVACLLVAVCVFVAVLSYPVVLARTPAVLVPELWVPVQVHKISEDIAGKTKEPKLALTLGPLFALEGGCDIYAELSAGAIIYRIGDLMTPADRAVTHTVGAQTLKEMVQGSPPSAVILRVETGRLAFLEGPLTEAIERDWERKVYEDGPVVYFRP
ncbi:MAG: hypothetical protein KAY65_05800 [Planctomycetes bacterium]|nr:hypothetical protein [Planctomycetota bacterium]